LIAFLTNLSFVDENDAASPVHPKNWYPIPLIFCKPWGILPNDVPCHPKLAEFANCMKKKGRGMSIFASILEGDYKDKTEESKKVCICCPFTTFIFSLLPLIRIITFVFGRSHVVTVLKGALDSLCHRLSVTHMLLHLEFKNFREGSPRHQSLQ